MVPPPWRQKGTGRARVGTTRSPIWVGGGRAFGPSPRDHYRDLPKKIRRLALRSALTVRAKEGRVTVLTDPGVSDGKTREVATMLKSLELDNTKCLLILDSNDPNVVRAGRNIRRLAATSVGQMNTYEVLWADHILITNAALDVLKEAPAK